MQKPRAVAIAFIFPSSHALRAVKRCIIGRGNPIKFFDRPDPCSACILYSFRVPVSGQ